MRTLLIAAIVGLGLVPQAPDQSQLPAEKTLQITFEPNGYVSLSAQNVTLREILAAWTRQGGCQFVNVDRITGGPITVQYEHQPETEVVASLLRQTAGYILGPRREGATGASRFEVVYITPTSRPVASGSFASPAASPAPAISSPGSPDDEIPPVAMMPGARGAQPGQSQDTPDPGPRTATTPSGVAVPVVPIVPVTATPPTTTTGRGRGGGGGN